MDRREFVQRYILAMRTSGDTVDLVNESLVEVHQLFDYVDKELEPFEDLNIAPSDECVKEAEEYTAEEVRDSVVGAMRDGANMTPWEVKSTPTTFVDDGLHRGLPVAHWEGALYNTYYFESYKQHRPEAEAALASAKAFRDGDIEGYRAMHGGV